MDILRYFHRGLSYVLGHLRIIRERVIVKAGSENIMAVESPRGSLKISFVSICIKGCVKGEKGGKNLNVGVCLKVGMGW